MSKPPFRLCSHIEKGGNQPMSEATDTDYWFLRDNGLNAKITLKILAIAYKVEKQLEEAEEEFFNDFHRTGGGGERQ